jgi:hypothetical protein
MIPTMTEVIQVSFQLVQVTFRASARVSRRNWIGLIGFFGSGGADTRAGTTLAGTPRRTPVGTMPEDFAISVFRTLLPSARRAATSKTT